MAEKRITLRPTGAQNVYTDGSDVEPLWSRGQDFGGEVRYWHQSGYGSFPESAVLMVPSGVGIPRGGEHG